MAGGRQPGGGREVHREDAEGAAGAEHQHQPRVHCPLRGEDPDQAGAGESEVHGIELRVVNEKFGQDDIPYQLYSRLSIQCDEC